MTRRQYRRRASPEKALLIQGLFKVRLDAWLDIKVVLR